MCFLEWYYEMELKCAKQKIDNEQIVKTLCNI